MSYKSISHPIDTFAGRPVWEFKPTVPITNPRGVAHRLHDAYGDTLIFPEKLELLLQDPQAHLLEALVVGPWGGEMWRRDNSSDIVVEALVNRRERLPNLQALFIGDITYHDLEISWIEQSNLGPLFDAFPLLEVLQVRGSKGLRFDPLRHERLKQLVVQSGGLDAATIRDIGRAHLPSLEHLELWLGSQEYGATATLEDLAPLLTAELFPKLTYLGLRDSDIADEIARALATAPILPKLTELDLSMGTMTDEGMQALFDGMIYTRLQTLNVSENYLSPEMVKRLREIPFEVITNEQKEMEEDDEDDWRYVSVGE